jgi:hypothetical protein
VVEEQTLELVTFRFELGLAIRQRSLRLLEIFIRGGCLRLRIQMPLLVFAVMAKRLSDRRSRSVIKDEHTLTDDQSHAP